jgi:hypothetical protein
VNPDEVWYRAWFALTLIVWHTRPETVRVLSRDEQLEWVRTTMLAVSTGVERRGDPGS